MLTILIIGRRGQLATELMRAVWPNNVRLIAFGREEVDVTNPTAIQRAFEATNPRIVINASAYTAVDRAESEPELAFAVNRTGPHHLAIEASRRGIPLIHVSTDYVFSGVSERPWQENDKPAPLGIYARSKLEGERCVEAACPQSIVLRTSWLFAAHGQNFVRTMLRLGVERDQLSIVNDQIGCPTSATDLARVIREICQEVLSGRPLSGTYHYAGQGPVTWYDFARAIFAAAGDLVFNPPILRPISTAEFGARAPRPPYSVLDCSKIERDIGISARSWSRELDTVLDEIRWRAPLLTSAVGY